MKRLFLILITSCVIVNAQQFEIAGYMQRAVAGGEAVVHGDKIYILGGYSDSLQITVDWIQSFIPSTDQWNLEGHMNIPRSNFSAGVIGDTIYYSGGVHGNMIFSKSLEFWDFNPISNPQTISQNAAFNRFFSSSVVSGSNLFIIGGLTMHGIPFIVRFNSELLTINGSFNATGIFNDNPLYQMTALVGDNIFIFGGVVQGISSRIYKINNHLDELIPLAPTLNIPRAGGKAVTIPETNEIYLIGGQNESNAALNSTEIINTQGDQIITRFGPDLNIPRSNFMSVVINGKIYVFGGFDFMGNVVSEIEVLTYPVTNVEEEDDLTPAQIELSQNYPNPFNPSTTIEYKINEPAKIKLVVYSLNGEQIKTLINTEQYAGTYKIQWDGTNSRGEKAADGVYFYRIESNKKNITKSMILLK